MFCPMPEVSVAAGGRVFRAFGHIAHKANQNALLNTLICSQRLQRHDPLAAAAARRLHDPSQHDDRHARHPVPGRRRVVQAARRPHRASSRARSSFPPELADGPVWKWMALDGGTLYALVGGQEIRPQTAALQRARHGPLAVGHVGRPRLQGPAHQLRLRPHACWPSTRQATKILWTPSRGRLHRRPRRVP